MAEVSPDLAKQPGAPKRFLRILYPVAAVLAIAAFIWHAVDAEGDQRAIDEVSLGLLGVLLLIPIAEHLRRLKLGSVEAEFDPALALRLEQLERRIQDLTSDQTAAAEGTAVAEAEQLAAPDSRPVRRIRRIVWVDDHPEYNRLEIEELKKRFDVIEATDTNAGLERIATDPVGTAVVTDAVRTEAGERNFHAGRELIEAVRAEHPEMPIFVYCGEDTVRRQEQELLEAGAGVVTASSTELIRSINTRAAEAFEGEVRHTLARLGNVRAGEGVDLLFSQGDREVVVEAKNWIRRPTARAIDSTYTRVARELEKTGAAEGWIIVPTDRVSAEQRSRAPDRVSVRVLDELVAALSPPA
ncbi:MAG: hypothetical protein M3320_04290 [Actinomycetota bacterium]|nr:hypothetical protein [Actinomycetota bacterium]